MGYYPNGDEAAEACWQRYLELHRVRHKIASRVHGSADTNAEGKLRESDRGLLRVDFHGSPGRAALPAGS